jgi:hypothetical protein
LHGGSRFARDMAEQMGKPFLHADLDQLPHHLALTMIREWLAPLQGEKLNVAGPRASSDGRIYKAVKKIITDLLKSEPRNGKAQVGVAMATLEKGDARGAEQVLAQAAATPELGCHRAPSTNRVRRPEVLPPGARASAPGAGREARSLRAV